MRIQTKTSLNTSKTKQGFTIVELMLAMTFVATLLISIAVVTINIVTILSTWPRIKSRQQRWA